MYGMVWHVLCNVSDIPVRTDRTVRHRCCHLWLKFGIIKSVKFIESILHFTKGTKNFYSHHYNPPQMGYRWVRADPRITPGWTHPGNSGSGTGKSGKTGKSVSRPFCLIAAEPGHLQTW